MVGARVPWLALPVLVAALSAYAPQAAADPVGDATALYRQKKFSEARAILEPLTAAEPSNAAAAYMLGMVFLRQGGPSSLDSARLWLGKAMRLAPANAGYLADYAGVCLLMADRDNSFSLALEGRDAMTRAIAADPKNIEACQGLMRFYAKAPWPLGNPTKALALAAQIAKLDPKKGAAAYLAISAIFEKDGHGPEAHTARQAAQSLAPDPPH
jgi:cytochrome c-type biogenesis protein CcmH/NrfG